MLESWAGKEHVLPRTTRVVHVKTVPLVDAFPGHVGVDTKVLFPEIIQESVPIRELVTNFSVGCYECVGFEEELAPEVGSLNYVSECGVESLPEEKVFRRDVIENDLQYLHCAENLSRRSHV
jgi:hypothetical protein